MRRDHRERLRNVPPGTWIPTGIGLVAIGYLAVAVHGLLTDHRDAETPVEWAIALLALTGWAMSRRHRMQAALLVLGTVWAEEVTSIFIEGTLVGLPVILLPSLVMAAGLLLGARAAIVTAVATVLAAPGVLALRPLFGLPDVPTHPDEGLAVVVLTFAVLGTALLVRSAMGAYGATLGALDRNRRRYAELFESSPDGLVVVDEGGRLVEANARAVHLLGGEGGRLVGAELEDVLDVLPTEGAPRDPADSTGNRRHERLAQVGSRTLEVTSRVVEGESPGEVRTLLVLRDLTRKLAGERERAALLEHLGQGQRLETVGRLAGGVAHDFNNLLTSIGGNASLLASNADVEVRELAGEILEAQQLGSELTRQLLTFARRDLRRVERFDLGDMAVGLDRLLRRLLDGPHRLRLSASGQTPVRGDRTRLEQVVVNLVTNAREAMPDGGEVGVTVRALPGSEARELGSRLPDDEQALLEVVDAGVGMSSEVREHLFEPFFTTRPMGRGRGLGLSAVHGIVARAGGHVHAESEVGRGSTFRVFLPLAVAAVEGAQPGPGAVGAAPADEAAQRATRRSKAKADVA